MPSPSRLRGNCPPSLHSPFKLGMWGVLEVIVRVFLPSIAIRAYCHSTVQHVARQFPKPFQTPLVAKSRPTSHSEVAQCTERDCQTHQTIIAFARSHLRYPVKCCTITDTRRALSGKATVATGGHRGSKVLPTEQREAEE